MIKIVKVFFPKEGVIKIDAAGTSSIIASTVLGTAFSAATVITGQFKDISITLPTADVDKIDLIGVTSSFQNAELEDIANQAQAKLKKVIDKL